MPNVEVNVNSKVNLDAAQATSSAKSLATNMQSASKATSDWDKQLNAAYEDVLGMSKSTADLLDGITNLKNQFKQLHAANEEAFNKSIISAYSDGMTQITSKFEAMNNALSQSETKTSSLVAMYRQLGTEITQLQTSAQGRSQILPADMQQQIAGLSGQYNQLGQQLQSNITDKLKSGFKELGSIAKKSFNDIYNISKTIITKSASYMKSAFTSVLNSIGDKFKSIFSTSASSGVASQLKSLLLGAGVVKGFQTAINLSSELTEAQNRLDYVFGESADSISEFARTTAKDFGLTENAATKFSATFGGILSSSGIASDELASFSENLTKMTGDLASFYDVDQDVFFKKLQAGLAGNAAALRTFGINVSATNLELYRQSKGIQTAYKDMDQATKITLRYNYIVESASQAQGDFARTQFTWANQIRTLKAQFQSLASIIGGYFIKTLLPVVRILNQIVQAAVNAFTALASLFGFDSDSIKELTGGAKGTVFDESAAGYIDDTADALDNESDALDKTGKAAKEAAENLQGFDKLNNITTSKASSAGSSGSGASGSGVGLTPLDWASLTKAPDLDKTSLEKWFDEFYDLLSNKKWKEAGKSLAQALNNVTDSIYDSLTDPKVKTGIHNFNDALTDFYDGLLEYDTKKLGQTIGAGINLIAYSINDLYDQAVKKDLLKKTGEKISDFFYGLATGTDWKEVGKAFTTGFRTAMDILAGFLEKAKEQDLGKEIGKAIKDFLSGAVERLFGDGGAEEIGSNISGVMNLAFESFATAFGKGSDGKSAVDDAAEGILTVIDTAIEGIDEKDLADALTALLDMIGTLFSMLGDIDTDTLSDKIAYAVNTAVDDGSVENAVSGITSAILNLFNLIGKTITQIHWFSLGASIISGIADGFTSTEGEGYLLTAFGLLFGVRMKLKVASFGLSILGKAIINSLAGNINTPANATTLGSSLSSLAGGLKATAFITVALAGTAAAAKAFNDFKDDMIDGQKEFDDATTSINANIVRTLKETGKIATENLTFDVDFDKTSVLDFTGALADIETAVGNADEVTQRYIATQRDSFGVFGDSYASQNQLKDVYYSMEEAIRTLGLSSSDAATKIRSLNNKENWDSQDKKDYAAAINTIRNETKELSNTIVDADSGLATELDSHFTYLSNSATKKIELAKKSAKQMTLDELSAMSTTLYSDTSVDTATSDLITDATSDSNTNATKSGSGVATNLTAGVTSALSSDTTVDSATSSLVADATLDSNTKANTKGSDVGSTLADTMATAINTDKKTVEAMISLVAKSTANETIKAYESGKAAGNNVLDGIDAGIKDDQKQAGVFTGIRNFATNLFTNFKDVLGIHSPSRVFKSLAAFIPEGVALGVEDNTKVATQAIGNMCSSLSDEFENTDVDTSSLISVGKFDGMYDSLMKQTDMAFDYVASKFDNLRDMINLQSNFVVNPSVNRVNLEAAYASASDVSGVVRSVGNIYSRLATGNLGSSSKPVQVNVYLDQNNKLSSYIIDTVNGNVTKTGNF